jgi:hypothetical protein
LLVETAMRAQAVSRQLARIVILPPRADNGVPVAENGDIIPPDELSVKRCDTSEWRKLGIIARMVRQRPLWPLGFAAKARPALQAPAC